MKLERQYLMLKDVYGDENEVGVTLQDLAETWGCTVRNAALLVGRMKERGWIEWEAKRGRSNRSRLVFRLGEEEIAEQIISGAVTKSDMLDALDQIANRASSPRIQARLEAKLLARLGFRRESVGRRNLDVLRLPVRQAPVTLDPMAMHLLAESFVTSHVYDSLVRIEDGRPVPHLAFSWETNRDGTCWTFRLRRGVWFHHGKELDSEDAAFTLNRLRQAPPGTLYRQLFRRIRHIRILDQRSFSVELDAPLAFLPQLLATGRAGLLPADLGRTEESRFRRRPVGTGPFKVAEFKDRLIVLEAFPEYFRERAHLDRVEIWALPEDEPGSPVDGGNLFRIIHNPRDVIGREPDWKQIGSDVTVSKFLTVNNRKSGPLTDPEVRKVVLGLLTQEQPDEAGTMPVPEIRTMLEQFRRPLRMATIQPYAKDVRTITETMEQAGIPVEVELLPPEGFTGDRRLESDLLFFTLIRDRESLLRQYDLFLSMTEHFDDRDGQAVRMALMQIDREPDRAGREERMQDIESRLIRNHLMAIWQERKIRTAVHASVGGAEANAQGWVDLRKLWFA